MSLGAGVYEETVFRLGIMTGVAVLLERVARPPPLGRGDARAGRLGGAVLGDAPHPALRRSASRSACSCSACSPGCFFGLVFWFRGFAVAVYTHALYDIYVLVVR